VALPVETVKKVQKMNRAGQKPEKLVSENMEVVQKAEDTFLNMVGQEDINRFNKPKGKQRKKKRRPPNQNPNQNRNRKPRKTMKKLFILFSLFGIILAGFTSCDSARVFDKYHEISDSEWHKDSLVVFKIPVNDTLNTHNLLLQIRNETNYKYSNLWLFVEIEQPGGEVLRDTFEIVVADPSGRWLGKGFGGLKDTSNHLPA
jgi:gliding motility-associated lipoprotein GldH